MLKYILYNRKTFKLIYVYDWFGHCDVMSALKSDKDYKWVNTRRSETKHVLDKINTVNNTKY